MSDLHLETPETRPSYSEFRIQPRCQYLALLGDIGKVLDGRLFDFLITQLQQFEIVFYLLGNHEPYGMTFHEAQSKVQAFETEMRTMMQGHPGFGRFVFLNQTKYELPDITVLGCTLFSNITQPDSVSLFVSDFSYIKGWTVDSHNAAHQADLEWLNFQVASIARRDPNRPIVIFTHHSPTTRSEANHPNHIKDPSHVRSAFSTDISNHICWTRPQVKLWAFGHTHFNCNLTLSGKQVLANQKGRSREEQVTFDMTKVACVDTGTHTEKVGGQGRKGQGRKGQGGKGQGARAGPGRGGSGSQSRRKEGCIIL
ncbi:MAG: hypothetical protein M1839_005299 [Geoglossum umbratile]|nr:MAG: hypothetical protein M1839_005299 [Geoglossum umbratile]